MFCIHFCSLLKTEASNFVTLTSLFDNQIQFTYLELDGSLFMADDGA